MQGLVVTSIQVHLGSESLNVQCPVMPWPLVSALAIGLIPFPVIYISEF